MSPHDDASSPGIRVPPPLLFLAGFAAGWLLHRYVQPLHFASAEAALRRMRLLGDVLIILGTVLALWGALTFRRSGTSVLPFRAASALVTHGPYRFTRNPMYVGMSAAYAGLSFAMNTLWPIILLPATLFLLHRLVVSREEQHLALRFGTSYLDYRKRVRRWL